MSKIKKGANNKPVIGWLENYIPEELLHAAGLLPYRLRKTKTEGERSYEYLPSDFCAYSKNILNAALERKYDFLDGIIFTNTCTTMEKFFDVWSQYLETPFVYMLEIPRIFNERSLLFFEKKILNLKSAIESHFEVNISHDALVDAIQVYNHSRTILEEFVRLGRMDVFPGIPQDLFHVVKDAFEMDRRDWNKIVDKRIEIIKGEGISGNKVSLNLGNRPRIMMVGKVIDEISFIEMVADCGGRVVAEHLATGSAYSQGFVDPEAEKSPIRALSRRYLEKFSEFIVEKKNEEIMAIWEKVRAYHVDGIIVVYTPFCVNSIYNYTYLKTFFTHKGVPTLIVEDDSPWAKLITKIETFIETLRILLIGNKLSSIGQYH